MTVEILAQRLLCLSDEIRLHLLPFRVVGTFFLLLVQPSHEGLCLVVLEPVLLLSVDNPCEEGEGGRVQGEVEGGSISWDVVYTRRIKTKIRCLVLRG